MRDSILLMKIFTGFVIRYVRRHYEGAALRAGRSGWPEKPRSVES